MPTGDWEGRCFLSAERLKIKSHPQGCAFIFFLALTVTLPLSLVCSNCGIPSQSTFRGVHCRSYQNRLVLCHLTESSQSFYGFTKIKVT